MPVVPMFTRELRRRRLATAPTVGHARLGRAIHAARGRRGAGPLRPAVIRGSWTGCSSDRSDQGLMVVVVLRPSGRGRGRPAATGRLVDWTVCSSAWRTWTRSTWSETSGAPDSAAPSTAPGGAAAHRGSSEHAKSPRASGAQLPGHSRLCQWCGRPLTGGPRRKFCSDAHKKAFHRKRLKSAAPPQTGV